MFCIKYKNRSFYHGIVAKSSQPTITQFKPPANITDFGKNSSLADTWDQFLSKRFEDEINGLSKNDKDHEDNVPPDQVCFFAPLKQPLGQLNEAHVTWFGFPNVLKAIYQDEKKAFQLADN